MMRVLLTEPIWVPDKLNAGRWGDSIPEPVMLRESLVVDAQAVQQQEEVGLGYPSGMDLHGNLLEEATDYVWLPVPPGSYDNVELWEQRDRSRIGYGAPVHPTPLGVVAHVDVIERGNVGARRKSEAGMEGDFLVVPHDIFDVLPDVPVLALLSGLAVQ